MPKAKTTNSEPKKTEAPTDALIPTQSLNKTNRILIIVACVFFGLAGIAYYFKSLFVVALVNGKPISRLAIISQLEKTYGKQTLDYLITKSLIEQEAVKKNINVEKKDIDTEIAKVETSLKNQGQNLDQALLLQGLTRKDFEKQISLNLLVQKLSTPQATISATEISQYIEKNKDSLPVDLTEEKLTTYVKSLIQEEKQAQSTQSWLTNLKQGANIQTWHNY